VEEPLAPRVEKKWVHENISFRSVYRGQDFGLNIEFLTLLGFTFHVPLFHPWGTLVQAHRQGKYIACCIKHS
jgi:hypothetical protein